MKVNCGAVYLVGDIRRPWLRKRHLVMVLVTADLTGLSLAVSGAEWARPRGILAILLDRLLKPDWVRGVILEVDGTPIYQWPIIAPPERGQSIVIVAE